MTGSYYHFTLELIFPEKESEFQEVCEVLFALGVDDYEREDDLWNAHAAGDEADFTFTSFAENLDEFIERDIAEKLRLAGMVDALHVTVEELIFVKRREFPAAQKEDA